MPPPCPDLNLPVVLGTIDGVAMIGGGVGLLVLKRRSDQGRLEARVETAGSR